MMYRGVVVVVVNKPIWCRIVSIGGGRSPVFVLKIQISNVVSNDRSEFIMSSKTKKQKKIKRLTYQRYYYTGPRQVPD